MMNKKHIAIVGAGAAGLMAAEVLSSHDDVMVSVYEHKPTAARKILMAGKTGLNISHAEPLDQFVSRYLVHDERLANYVQRFDANAIRAWMLGLGVESFVGSTGRIFPTQMKASVLVRAWLNRLSEAGVAFYYRHGCIDVQGTTLTLVQSDQKGEVIRQFSQDFDAVILACGGGSYAKLGSDGAWQEWFGDGQLTPLYPSNVGVLKDWSPFIEPLYGQAMKRVKAWVQSQHSHQGDIIISHYGLESGLIYRLNHTMRQAMNQEGFVLHLDLLPDKSLDAIIKIFQQNKKQSLNTVLKKLGLDKVKIAVLRECTNKTDWSDFVKMANHIKDLSIKCTGFRPIDEAISTGGGVKWSCLDDDLQCLHQAGLFCAGEMLDWDAPTGGYLLTACFATGRAAAHGVLRFLDVKKS